MARKLPQLQRALDAPTLASVAYGEIASSIYFALGIIALHALGLTPVVLGIVGLLFVVVALSYAEGTASIRETGGAATFVRVAFNDFAGFLTGWVLFLDYLIVISLSALFFGHYLGIALGIHSIATHPGDVITGCVLIGLIGLSRLARRTRLYMFGIIVPLVDLVTQLLLVVLGFAILFCSSTSRTGSGTSCGCTSGSPARSSCSRRRRRPSPASAGLRIRSASTGSSRACSAGCTAARSWRRRQSPRRPGSRSASSSPRRFSRTRLHSSRASSASAGCSRSPPRSWR